VSANVLIVDDEELVSFTLREILAQEGYRVQEAPTIDEAFARIERYRFDVALLDLRVGAESGLTVLARLQEVSPTTVALVMTGYGSLETAIEAMRYGAYGYLLKPCDVEELKATIARGLSQRRARAVADTEADAARALEEARRSRDDFLAIAGHELKTPLAVVIGLSQIAQRQLERGATAEATQNLAVLARRAHRMARLIDDFIDMMRVEQGGLKLELKSLDLAALIADVIAEDSGVYPRHEIDLEAPKDPVWVMGDPARLQQVFGNMIENAAKFSPDGSTIALTLEMRRNIARVTVRDEGVGMTADEIAHAFDPFYQADSNVMTRRFGGMGLGLYLADALVRAHRGDVRAESAGPGEGSLFTVRLPLGPRRTRHKAHEA
jgi:signal transduction histidine kinase